MADPTITTTALSDAFKAAAYTTTLLVSAGTAPFAWDVSSGTLPTGFTLSAGGVLSGVGLNTGTYTFTVRVTDDDAVVDTQVLTLRILENPSMAKLVGITRSIATIAASGTISSAVGLGKRRLLGIQTPPSLTGTSLSFQMSSDNVTFVPMYTTAGSAVSITVGTSRFVPVDPNLFLGVEFLKVVSGSTEGSARDIVLLAGDLLFD
jgi:hypothetical protein